MTWILDDAGFVAGTYDGPGQPANSTNVPPPDNTAVPQRFVSGAWVLADASAPAGRIITRLAFRKRFTLEEKVAIEMAALDQPDASTQVRRTAAMLRAYLKDVDAAERIDLDDQDTVNGVMSLMLSGLLPADRGNAILDGEVQDAERPN